MIHFEKRDRYLLITGGGERNTLLTLADGTKMILSSIAETQSRLVLADYRNVQFNIPNSDAFNVLRYYESKMTLPAAIIVAAVLGEQYMGLGAVWRDVAKARGLCFEVFYDITEAENWLLKQ